MSGAIKPQLAIANVSEIYPGYLLGEALVYGRAHHVEFIRVATINHCMFAWADKSIQPDPKIVADGEAGVERFNDYQKLYSGYYQTVNVPGFIGEYVCCIFPVDLA